VASKIWNYFFFFDNVLVTDSQDYAKQFGEETWGKLSPIEKQKKESQEAADRKKMEEEEAKRKAEEDKTKKDDTKTEEDKDDEDEKEDDTNIKTEL